MHEAVLKWVAEWSVGVHSVLDLGGRDVNGTCRALFPEAEYLSVDIQSGPGVDVVGDAGTWRSTRRFDAVLCTEVFEHVAAWRDVCQTAFEHLEPGGRFIVTCAGPGRPAHSGRDAVPTPEPDEHYANVSCGELAQALVDVGFRVEVSWRQGLDTQAVAFKPVDG